VIDISKLSGDIIKFGAIVDLIDEDTDEKVTYQIVGELEANASEGMISVIAPIARALMGKSIGDNVEVVTPGGGKSYEVLGVNYG